MTVNLICYDKIFLNSSIASCYVLLCHTREKACACLFLD